MPDTFTSSLRIQLMATGGDPETWGVIANTQFSKFESAITGDNGYAGGTGGISLTGLTSPLALTVNNGTLDQAAQLLYPFVGTLLSDFTVTLPGVVKIGWVVNATTGGHNVILKVGSGTTLSVPPGGNWSFFYCDGANVIAPSLSFASGVGPITVNGNATINGNATVSGSLGASSASIAGTTTSAGVTSTNGFTSTALDDGGAGGQFRATFGNFGVMLRNDGASAFLLQTASGQQGGQFNTFRPYAWNLSTGAVTIDGTGIGTRIGGAVAVVGNLSAANDPDLVLGSFGGNPTLNFAPNQFLQFVGGDGFTLSTTGTIHLGAGVAVLANGSSVVTNNGGTYSININGTAVLAAGAPWAGITGKPFAFNQSTDINASPTFTNIQANGYLNISGTNSLSSTGVVITAAGGSFTPAPWTLGVSVACAGAVAATQLVTISDRRLKGDIRDISAAEAIHWVQRGRPRHFTLYGKPTAGFLAQEDLASGRGEVINKIEDENFAEGDGFAPPGFRLVRDNNQDGAYLTAALKDALRQIIELTARVEDLEDAAD